VAFLFENLRLPGLVLVHTTISKDERGFFMETYKRSVFAQNGISDEFVQDNHSRSTQGVLRGLHYQTAPAAQGKLVRVVEGVIWDVAVDIRPASPTFRQWYGIELSQESGLMLYLPPGFAHGFVTLSKQAQFLYKCTAEFNPACEGGYCWNDASLGIEWPLTDVRISPKDAALPTMEAAK